MRKTSVLAWHRRAFTYPARKEMPGHCRPLELGTVRLLSPYRCRSANVSGASSSPVVFLHHSSTFVRMHSPDMCDEKFATRKAAMAEAAFRPNLPASFLVG